MIPAVLVAIDPGYAKRGQGCAVALFVSGVLASVRFLRPANATPDALAVCATLVVWECPQVDDRTRCSVPHVVELAAVGAELAGLFAGACGAKLERVTPSQWKGSTPKPVAHARMWERLSFAERALLGGDTTIERVHAAQRAGALERWAREGAHYYGAWQGHNTLDAVGLGLWKLGRCAT